MLKRKQVLNAGQHQRRKEPPAGITGNSLIQIKKNNRENYSTLMYRVKALFLTVEI